MAAAVIASGSASLLLGLALIWSFGVKFCKDCPGKCIQSMSIISPADETFLVAVKADGPVPHILVLSTVPAICLESAQKHGSTAGKLTIIPTLGDTLITGAATE